MLARLGGRTFASLRHRDYRLYFAGSAVSFVGTWMQQIAAYWLILELTESPVAVGALALVQTLPVTAFALVGGAIADRVDLRRMVIACESVLAVVAAVLAALALTGAIEAWQLYALGFVQGIALALDAPARHTLVFRIVGRDDLPNAVGLSSGLGTTARIVGPALGGVVVATAGAGVAFAANAVSYVIVIGAIPAMRISPRPTEAGAATPILAGVARDLPLRVRLAARHGRVPRRPPREHVLVQLRRAAAAPREPDLDEGAEVFGLIASVFGAGALCGALILATIGRARLALVLGGAAGFGGFQLLLAPQDTLLLVCALLFVIGIFYVLWGSSALATLQLAAPDHLRGRAASLYFFAFQGGAPLGGLLAGVLVAHGGTQLAFAFAGTVAVLTALVGIAVVLTRREPRALPRVASRFR